MNSPVADSDYYRYQLGEPSPLGFVHYGIGCYLGDDSPLEIRIAFDRVAEQERIAIQEGPIELAFLPWPRLGPPRLIVANVRSGLSDDNGHDAILAWMKDATAKPRLSRPEQGAGAAVLITLWSGSEGEQTLSALRLFSLNSTATRFLSHQAERLTPVSGQELQVDANALYSALPDGAAIRAAGAIRSESGVA